jgi:hypothetical protein
MLPSHIESNIHDSFRKQLLTQMKILFWDIEEDIEVDTFEGGSESHMFNADTFRKIEFIWIEFIERNGQVLLDKPLARHNYRLICKYYCLNLTRTFGMKFDMEISHTIFSPGESIYRSITHGGDQPAFEKRVKVYHYLKVFFWETASNHILKGEAYFIN